jgi:hypothetical protein
LQLKTVDPAVIVNMRLRCEYPDYLQASNSSINNPVTRPANETLEYRNGMRVPEGTKLTLLGRANTLLGEVQYVDRSALAQTAPDTDENPVDVASTVRSVAPDGTEFAIALGEALGSRVVEVRLLDRFGLCSEQIPRYVLAIQEDTIPEVSTQFVGIGSAITPNAILPVTGTITDDHGIAVAHLELACGDERLIKVPLQLINGEKLEQKIDLRLLAEEKGFELQAGESLGLAVTAEDFFNLNEQTHEGRGQPQLMSVVTDDELLVILDRNELELRQRLERIMAELEQLREALQLLATSEMPAEDTASASRSVLGLVAPRQVAASAEPRSNPSQPTSSASPPSGQPASFKPHLVSLQDDDQQRRMLLFRAQQSVLQGEKSEQELAGVASRVENIRMQLENNRIDSYDRQTRLRDKVFLPLNDLLSREYKTLTQELAEMQSATMSGGGSRPARDSISALDAILVKLEAIRDSMLDIESFNEIVELVRGLLAEQESLIQEAEEAQKRRILDLLK